MTQSTEEETLEILQRHKAVITGSHIVYTSGKHGSAYVNKDAIYPHPEAISTLCHSLAEAFVEDDVQVVIAPAIGGVILSHWIAHILPDILHSPDPPEVLGVFAEKEDDFFVIKRGYDKLVAGKNVLVVEDILTTGKSVKMVVAAARAVGGTVVGVGALVNRGNVTAKDVGGVPKLVALASISLEAWDEADCPLCKYNVPINTDVGHGRKFLARKCG